MSEKNGRKFMITYHDGVDYITDNFDEIIDFECYEDRVSVFKKIDGEKVLVLRLNDVKHCGYRL